MNIFPGWIKVLALVLVASLLPLISFGADFEIPLSELAKVKKKAPAKPTAAKKVKKSRKDGAEKAPAAAEEAVASKDPDAPKVPIAAKEAPQPSKAVAEAGRIVLDEQQPAATPAQEQKPVAEAGQAASPGGAKAAPSAVPMVVAPVAVPVAAPTSPRPAAVPLPAAAVPAPVQPTSVGASIIHDPNSYIVAGKRTVILAIISATGELRSVQCHFRAATDGASASVAMVKVPGTRFTYSALIPALAPGSTGLRYGFTVTGATDKVVRSREYEIKVLDSPVVPGWQLDNFEDKLRVSRENPGKPLEGFLDAGLNR